MKNRTLKTILIVCLLTAVHSTYAQLTVPSSKGAIGITFSGLGANEAFLFESIYGGGGYDGKGYFSLGITYVRPLTQYIDIETGVSYSQYKYRFSNSSLGPEGPDPFNLKNGVVDIPLTIRWKFLKYLFLNGGLLIAIDTGMDNYLDSQTGIGGLVGVGAKYDLTNIPIGLFINPYIKINNLIPISLEKYHWRTTESGFRIGVVYYLP